MKTAAVIAEYNPFHNGHAKQIHVLKKELGYDYVIAIMSPDFVQRGMPALTGVHDRALAALSGGADAVFALPVCLATGSAEFFARGGVAIADSLGAVDALCFGCENPDLSMLRRIASALNDETGAFRAALKENLSAGMSFPRARASALAGTWHSSPEGNLSDRDQGADAALFLGSPNNLLAVEYMRALSYARSALKPLPIRREGAAYHEASLPEKDSNDNTLPDESTCRAASATALRAVIAKEITAGGDPERLRPLLQPHMPAPSLESLLEAIDAGRVFCPQRYDLLLGYALQRFVRSRTAPPGTSPIQDVNDAIAARIARCLDSYTDAESFSACLHTRDLAHSRLNRALLHILLDLPASLPGQVLALVEEGSVRFPGLYAQLIGFRREASPLIRAIQDSSSIPVITKPADAKGVLTGCALSSFETDMAAQMTYRLLTRKTTERAGYRKSVIVL